MIRIRRAAEITGIPEATLRIWERRYGLGADHRSESGYRLYDTDSILAIKEMQRLIDSGWSVNEAAQAVLAKKRAAKGVAGNGAEGGFDLLADLDFSRFFEAIQRLDGGALNAVLDDVFSKAEFEVVIDSWLAPTLTELGERWHKGELSIASEHFASNAIMRRLGNIYDGLGSNQLGPRVIVGAPKGSSHEIGPLAFAIAAKRKGFQVTHLGVELPPESWVDAAKQNVTDAVVMSVKMPDDVNVTESCISSLRKEFPNLKIALGGTFAKQVKGADLELPGGISESIKLLHELLV